MKWTKRPERKTWYLAAAAMIAILAMVGSSFAAYTNQSHLRGTVRNQSGQHIRFTSNYMQACGSNTEEKNYASRNVLFSEDSKKEDTTLSVEIEVYNYMKSTELVSDDDIDYTMTIQIIDGTEGSSYTVTKENGPDPEQNGNTYIFKNQTLLGRNANSHKYVVTFPGSDTDKVKIVATAVPDKLSLTNNQKLAAVIAPCTAADTAVFRCTGTFTDAASGAAPKDYDAFNYEVSISSGRANVTLTWGEAVEIDPFFLKKLEARGDSYKINGKAYIQNGNSLTFIMDQTTGTGDYLIPFYIVDKAVTDSKNWAGMSSIISVKGEAIED